jgi:hypothetical protein
MAAGAALVIGTMLAALLGSTASAANTIYVGCPGPGGLSSKLIYVLRHANQGLASKKTFIYLYPGCTYTLYRAANFPDFGANGLPLIKTTVVINGRGATIQRDEGAPRFRIFGVMPNGSLTLRDLTITNGRARSGQPGNGHLGADGEQGRPGHHGGAIYNHGTLKLDGVTLTNNRAGNGGEGGWSTGIDGANGQVAGASGGDGGNANGGGGGAGGHGGAIYSEGKLILNDSTLSNNQAGQGGRGGDATGGDGGHGLFGTPGGNGGNGGHANPGVGGFGGDGGAIYSSGSLKVTNSTLDDNRAGDGADMGTADGGDGGNGASEEGNGGDGGSSNAFFGGFGGEGGAVYQSGSSAVFDFAAFIDNTAGDGGDATAGPGNGGHAGCDGDGGNGGGAVSSAGLAGTTGAIYNDGSAINVTNSSFTGNDPGSGGTATNTPAANGANGGACT